MIGLIRTYLDGIAERDALRLLEADLPKIHRWKVRVAHNVNKRRGKRGNLIPLRVRRYG